MQKQVEITYGMLAAGNKRFANFIIDRIIVTICHLVIASAGDWLYDIYGDEGFLIGPPDVRNLKFALLGIGVQIFYYGLFESVWMRTPAKFITNTMVVNRDGSTPDNVRIFLRTICRQIPLEELSFLGRRPIGFHDVLSKTLVVDIYEFKKAKRNAEVDIINNNEENDNYV